MIRGFDISKHQGAVHFPSFVRAGYEFVFIKATEGQGYIDPGLAPNVRGAATSGLYVGFYHFARVSLAPGAGTERERLFRDARAEADDHVAAVSPYLDGALPCVLDLEWDKRVAAGIDASDLVYWATIWLNRVHKLTGKRPIVYTGPSFWRYRLGRSLALAEYPLWQADYRKRLRPIPGWPAQIWQHTGSAPRPDFRSREMDENYLLAPAGMAWLAAACIGGDMPVDGLPDTPVVPMPIWARAAARVMQKYLVSARAA